MKRDGFTSTRSGITWIDPAQEEPMLDVTLTATLTLKGPVMSRSSEPGRQGVDSVMARDSGDSICLPSSLVKGRLRESLCEIYEASKMDKEEIYDWLGRKSETRRGWFPDRGLLDFSDFVNKSPGRDETLFRISIDRERGAVTKGNLQVIESPFAVGEEINFTGKIRFFARDKAQVERIRSMLEAGLRWSPVYGSGRTTGFGRTIGAKVEAGNMGEIDISPVPVSDDLSRLDITIRPEDPFCIARPRVVENLFESDSVIPGAVIKGCLADIWLRLLGCDEMEIEPGIDDQRPELCRYFSRLRFTHAFPAAAGSAMRPVTPPYSLVKIHAPQLFDVALRDRPGLIDSPPCAPIFHMDWKESGDVREKFGWAEPERKLRVHTAIENNRAKENNLYAYEMIVPKGCEWFGRIDLNGVLEADRPAVASQLRGLLRAGLRSLGKTDAYAAINFSEKIADKIVSSPEPVEGLWIITLQAAALLCDPAELDERSGEARLRIAYEKAWSDISDNRLKLVRYFAGQTLAGGEYLHRRFQAGKSYNPFLLTEGGSVFVLAPCDDSQEGIEKAKKCVTKWLAIGLPVPQWAVDRYADGDRDRLWSRCPYIPENGYGEIAVNLPVHQELCPKGAFHAIS